MKNEFTQDPLSEDEILDIMMNEYMEDKTENGFEDNHRLFTSRYDKGERLPAWAQPRFFPEEVQDFLLSGNCREDQKEWINNLPWQMGKVPEIDIQEAEDIMMESHYGLEDIKQRILEYISLQKHLGGSCGTVLLLTGPPGVGKTSICKAIAKAMKRTFMKVPMDGIMSAHEIKGSDKSFKNAQPGIITRALRRCGSLCPVILLDEIDKLGGSKEHGDPQSALLEALDTDRSRFLDGFLEIPIDLSNVVFIATANSISEMSSPLLDRMDIVELRGYSVEEKLEIARRHVIPQEINGHKLTEETLKITDSALRLMVEQYSPDPGIRQLLAAVKVICRKAVFYHVTGRKKQLVVDERTLSELLGDSLCLQIELGTEPEVGVVNALAVTNAGMGVTFPVEVSTVPGHGNITYTGGMSEDIKESCEVAKSIICSNSAKLGLLPGVFNSRDIHIHALMTTIKKSGPSMGLALYCVLVSSLLNKPLRNGMGLTGEISLRGKVLPVGGIREKVTAAYRAGLRNVIIPYANRHDIKTIPASIRSEMKIELVDDVHTAISKALIYEQLLANCG